MFWKPNGKLTHAVEYFTAWAGNHISLKTHRSILRPALQVLAFQDDLHKVLGGHFAVPREALVGTPVALGHAFHHQVLAAVAGDPHVVAWIDDLPIAIPRQLVLIWAGHAAGKGHLTSHAALHLTWTYDRLQGLWNSTVSRWLTTETRLGPLIKQSIPYIWQWHKNIVTQLVCSKHNLCFVFSAVVLLSKHKILKSFHKVWRKLENGHYHYFLSRVLFSKSFPI